MGNFSARSSSRELEALAVGTVIAAIASCGFGMDDEVEALAAVTVQRLPELGRDLALRPVR